MFWVLGVGTALSQSERCPDSTQENFFQRSHIILTNKVLTRTIRVNKKNMNKMWLRAAVRKSECCPGRRSVKSKLDVTFSISYLLYRNWPENWNLSCWLENTETKSFYQEKTFPALMVLLKKVIQVRHTSVGSELNVLIRTLLPLTVTRFSEYNHHFCVWF